MSDLKTRNKVIEIKNLCKKYGSKIIFDNLNLNIFEKDRIALLGENGVGKTTLIETICGLRDINSGSIEFKKGIDNFSDNLGIQFQSGNYPQGIRVCDLIYLYTKVYKQKVDPELEKELEIKELRNKSVNDLSFGQKKRTELFLLLSTKPKFLILDEITAGIDIYVKIKILKILKNYITKNQIEVIYISHNLEEIDVFCNRILILKKEGIVFDQKITPELEIEKIVKSFILKSNNK